MLVCMELNAARRCRAVDPNNFRCSRRLEPFYVRHVPSLIMRAGCSHHTNKGGWSEQHHLHCRTGGRSDCGAVVLRAALKQLAPQLQSSFQMWALRGGLVRLVPEQPSYGVSWWDAPPC